MWKIKERNYPVFGQGYHPADCKGRVDIVELEVRLFVGDIEVMPGDFLLGDEDCIVVPLWRSRTRCGLP